MKRLQILVQWLFGEVAPKPYPFHAGDVLIAEGEAELRRPAMLVIDGELEECVGSYSSESGPGEHTVHVARKGDIADLQAIVEPYTREPAVCSVHANTDGSCYPVWRAQIEERPEVDAVLALIYEGFSEALDRQRAMATETEELAARLRDVEGGAGGEPQRISARAVIDEWDDTNREELARKLEELQDELDRAQLAAWEARERQQEAQRGLDLERRARAALEQRLVELMRQLAGQASPEPDERFPSAIRILESTELEEMESSARRHREMAENYVNRARMLHRAFELLASDNPGIVIKPKVMQLMLGEEPESRDFDDELEVEPDPHVDSQGARRITLPFEPSDSDPPSGPPLRIPPSAPVPKMFDSLAPDEACDEPAQTPAPGTRRSR